MSHQQYGKASYWDDRYTKDPEIFDWYQVREAGYCNCVLNALFKIKIDGSIQPSILPRTFLVNMKSFTRS